MDITEIQDELLRLEYPNLLPDHDPDIERYYYLRSIGMAKDAMNIFQNRLAPRYPDEQFRTWLLRAYRSHDPMFRSLLAKGYRMLGARSLERVKHVILIIADLIESFNEKDVYSTIKTIESILKFLPQERYEAVAGMDRFVRYANALNLRLKSIVKAADLVRAYLTDTLSVVEAERRRRSDAQRRMEEMERKRLAQADWDSYYFQKKFGFTSPMLDLSSVVFSPEDLARIEIPNFSRIEDQILSYCLKYWNAVDDPAFERILFLYSRKYGKKNYEVYTAIRRGQQAKRRDDEILASIMGTLVTGYYYSIQGDLYLQRSWNQIKKTLLNPKAPLPYKTLPAPAAQTKQVPAQSPKNQLSIRSTQSYTEENKKALSKPPRSSAVKKQIKQKTKVESMREPARKRAVRALPAKLAPRVKKPSYKIVPKPQAAAQARIRPAAVVAPKPMVAKHYGNQISINLPQSTRSYTEKNKEVLSKTPRSSAVKKQKLNSLAKPVAAKPPIQQPKTNIFSRLKPKPATAASKPMGAKAHGNLFSINVPRSTQSFTEKNKEVLSKTPRSSAVKKQKLNSLIKPVVAKPAPFVPPSPPSARPPIKVVTAKTLGKAKGSVSDRLKKLSGRSYDVYEDRFLAKARASIRKVLGTGKGLFFSLPEEAEDLVYNFLRDHYSDPYMDWEDSVDKKNLMSMGFDLPSINPVIDECYRAL